MMGNRLRSPRLATYHIGGGHSLTVDPGSESVFELLHDFILRNAERRRIVHNSKKVGHLVVEKVDAQQIAGDPALQAKRLTPPTSAGCPFAAQQPKAAERRFGREPVPKLFAGGERISEIQRSQDLYREIGGWIFAVGIVLHIGVEAFEAGIDFRRQTEKEHIPFKGTQMKQARHNLKCGQ
jgi:hypothetical protein